MQIRRVSLLILLSAIIGISIPLATASRAAHAQTAQQQLVETVDIQGNRRLRDEDILYYVQTRAGDVFNQQQVERDLQAILALGFFDKTATRVLTEEGVRGGVNVIFEVKELPIIRDIQFEGLKSVPESDVLKAFREQRVGISKESIYDPVKARNAVRVIKELLATHGKPNATVEIREDEVSATSTAITFVVKEGDKVRIVDIKFEGNSVFSDGKLRSQLKLVKESGLISRFRGQDILNREKLDYDLNNVRNYMRSKGYLQARTGEPRVEGLGKRRTGFFIPLPFISSTDEALRVTVPITEGKLYRIGSISIEGNSIFSEQAIQSVIGLKQGDVADGKRISDALFKSLKNLYGSQGFIQYEADPQPDYKDNPAKPDEGIVDFKIDIREGRQYTLSRLEFLGNTFTRDNVLRREVLINEGDIYSQTTFEYSIIRLNQLGYFDPIDKDKDVDYRTDEDTGNVAVNVKVNERGRQQISFNGGLGASTGSFFGLDYSTNNLLGRGETLSFQLAYGNRQRSFQFSFTEPYLRDRPITVGFSLFTYSQKFFGEGTQFSTNREIQLAQFSPLGLDSVSNQNLFTRNSYGASLFASAPLSEFYRKRRFTQFSRVGVSYSFSLTSVKDPPVNADVTNQQNFIPVIYSQPSIITSRISPSFIYDTRAFTRDANDPTSGKQISATLSFAGLGGDVRTYQPSISYIQFIPLRKKGTKRVEVFGFRILAGSVGSFATSNKVRNSNSLAFVNGVPIFERYFLGDEFTLRGYNVRSISPIAPVDLFVTSRNVIAASNSSGTPTAATGLPASFAAALAQVGTFTGSGGSNPTKLGGTTFTSVGGDTQILGNFEYRIPLIGPASMAAFADVGTVFNLRKGDLQIINSNFLSDQPFLFPFSLSQLALQNNPQLASSPLGGLVIRGSELVLREDYAHALEVGPIDPTTFLPVGMRQVFLRGDAQTNTLISVGDSRFARFSDIRSSVGLELRVQVPIVNVPFRLIYAYNPNARNGVTSDVPNFFFNERKSVFRFSVGRTF